MQTTGTDPTSPKQRFPAWPTTFEVGMFGMSVYGIFGPPSASAKAPRPLPRTRPTRGVMFVFARIARTVSSSRAWIGVVIFSGETSYLRFAPACEVSLVVED